MALVLAVGACGPRNQGPTEILWDRWGVPHIQAANAEELFRAFGWAQMRNHANLILRLYGEARGRAAEYWGESYLVSDRYLRTMGVPERAQQWYREQRPRFKGYLDRFVEGMNAYALKHPESIDPGLRSVLPLDPTDVLGHLQRVIHLSFVGREVTFGRAGQAVPGSNGWAIAPSRSAGGNAMLLVNPHLPWSSFFTWFEVQWTTPQVDAYGATLVGMPILGLGFNDHLGWTHTTNPLDGIDLFELSLAEGGYRWDGEVRAFETETQSIRVRQPDGTVRRETLTVLRSIHGPVLEVKGDKAVAVRLVGLDQPHMFEQYWDMIRARNLREFESALRRLQNPIFNLIYADREGHILYLFGGRTPVRASGGWQDWQGMVAGDRPEMLWSRTQSLRGIAEGGGPFRRVGAERQRSALELQPPEAAEPRRFSRLSVPPRDAFPCSAIGAHAGAGTEDQLRILEPLQAFHPDGIGRPHSGRTDGRGGPAARRSDPTGGSGAGGMGSTGRGREPGRRAFRRVGPGAWRRDVCCSLAGASTSDHTQGAGRSRRCGGRAGKSRRKHNGPFRCSGRPLGRSLSPENGQA